jgi:Gamma tubulin complex component C-terminal
LQYKPSFPLDAVITSPILERYDRLFLFLVRVFRMQYVAAQLFRDSSSKASYTQAINPLAQRFRIEAHHFITAIASYIFNVSITSSWHAFLAHLPHAKSLSEMRELHARCVDTMCVTSFLKKRQSPILTLLYGTFETILLFAKQSRVYALREQRVWARMREEMEDNTRILYGMFVKRAGMFVRVIGELERRGVGRGVGEGEGIEGGWFEDLLVRLDGSYFDRV